MQAYLLTFIDISITSLTDPHRHAKDAAEQSLKGLIILSSAYKKIAYHLIIHPRSQTLTNSKTVSI